jgi:co-chaperonin GroES (HSP10)
MKAFGDKIFVKVFEKDEVTSSGIMLVSKSKKETPRFGKVVSVGDLVTEVSENDIVSFGNYALKNPVNDLYAMVMEDIFGYFKV